MSLHMDFFFIEGIPNPNLHCSGTPLKHSFSGAFQIHACPGSLKQKVSYKKSRNPIFKKKLLTTLESCNTIVGDIFILIFSI